MNCKKIKKLEDVPSWQLCCGCGVCAYLYPEHIEMVDVPETGRRPKFVSGTNGIGECFQMGLDVCPGVKLHHQKDAIRSEKVIGSLEESWGPILEIWEAYALDSEIRYKGSSGGAITAISLYCLEQEKMDGILHVTGDQKKPYLNSTTISKDRDTLLKGTGSRYSPASPCEKLGEVEGSTGLHVIVGKPCDIAAVQSVRKIKEKLDSKIGLTIACFCAGTPSTNGTLEMLRQMGVDKVDDLSALRYRGHGWPGKMVAEGKVKNKTKKYRKLTYEDSWGKILQKYRQWRCYICPDHTGEFADLAVGDPWYRDREQSDTGQSLILVRTRLGKKILDGAVAEGYLVAQKKKPEALPASQKNLEKTRARLWGQLLALKFIRAPCPDYVGFNLFHKWLSTLSFFEKIKSVLGTIKRVYAKKIKKKQILL